MLKLPAIISDGCVLREKGARLYGEFEPDGAVTVAFQGSYYTVKCAADRKWSLDLPELDPGGPFDLKIAGEVLSVYVGEVWLCSGQSNMELTFERAGRAYPGLMQAAANPYIRQFKVPQDYDFHIARDYLTGGAWSGASPETIRSFSAAGYFFARKLSEKLKKPVGLVHAAVGGTPITAWLGDRDIQSIPYAFPESERVRDDAYVADTIRDDAEIARRRHAELDASDKGLKRRWFDAEYDDSLWDEINPEVALPEPGVVWYRKDFEVPAKHAGKDAELALGTIVDSDETWVNGEKIGETGYRYPPRYYNFKLREGTNVIAVRVKITGSLGKFTEGKERVVTFDGGCIRLTGEWRRRRGAFCERFPSQTFFRYKPSGLYNGMIHPIKSYPVDGVLWYQGESDSGSYEDYYQKFKMLVERWRGDFGLDLPFLTVGLARFDEGDWSGIREQQFRCAERIPGVKIFDAWDFGERNDLHPLDKKSVGEGLAGIYLANT